MLISYKPYFHTSSSYLVIPKTKKWQPFNICIITVIITLGLDAPPLAVFLFLAFFLVILVFLRVLGLSRPHHNISSKPLPPHLQWSGKRSPGTSEGTHFWVQASNLQYIPMLVINPMTCCFDLGLCAHPSWFILPFGWPYVCLLSRFFFTHMSICPNYIFIDVLVTDPFW